MIETRIGTCTNFIKTTIQPSRDGGKSCVCGVKDSANVEVVILYTLSAVIFSLKEISQNNPFLASILTKIKSNYCC